MSRPRLCFLAMVEPGARRHVPSRESVVKKMIVVVAGLFLLAFTVGCASTGQEESRTEVSGGLFVYDGDDYDREYSDEEVEQFARAYIEVMAVQQRFHGPITQAATPEERQALIEESEVEAQAVMYDHGLTVQEYNAIAVRMPEDDELRGRVQRAIQANEEERLRELQEAQ